MDTSALDDPRRFGDALAKGLGRCILHLQGGAPVEPYRELLLEAFRVNQAYDPQCEGTRSVYLLDLAEAADLEDELRNVALEGLATTDDRRDADQHTAVLVCFAECGDDFIRDRVLAQFESVSLDSRSFVSFAWVVPRLAGLDGFLRVARRMGEGNDAPGHHRSCDYHRGLANEDFGEDIVTAALHSSAATDTSIAAFVRYCEAERERARNPTPTPHVALAELLATLRADTENPRPWIQARRWAVWASAEELQQAAAALESPAVDPREQRLLLAMFQRLVFPGPVELLVRFVHAASAELRNAAIAALGAYANGAARAEAHRLLSLPEPVWEALGLFENNYQPGDGVFWASVLGKAPLDDRDALHELGLRLLDAACGDDRSDDVVAPLRWLYEHTPCSMCRDSAVRALLYHGALDAMAEECAWDVNDEIRELVECPEDRTLE